MNEREEKERKYIQEGEIIFFYPHRIPFCVVIVIIPIHRERTRIIYSHHHHLTHTLLLLSSHAYKHSETTHTQHI